MAHYQADMPELGACEDAAAQTRRLKKNNAASNCGQQQIPEDMPGRG